MMHQNKIDILAYNKAKQFLIDNTPDLITEEIILSYLSIPEPKHKDISLNEIYHRLLISAQNANMKASVIGGSIGGVQNLEEILFNFNPKKVLEKYSQDSIEILDDIIIKLKPNGKIRKTPKSIWPKYCRTIISAAEFLSQFSNSKEFLEWVSIFSEDKKLLAALPMIIESEIYGLGFPLACDFLKELGFINYGKPDIHIIEIFEALELIPRKSGNYQVLKAIIRIAESNNKTPYDVDKLFWLIGSGFFYNHQEIGNQGRVGRMKEKFIKQMINQ
tara:strand:- start:1171 stop:1995 length:825 start_codon:yes stop_codon:yes gene_type:complete